MFCIGKVLLHWLQALLPMPEINILRSRARAPLLESTQVDVSGPFKAFGIVLGSTHTHRLIVYAVDPIGTNQVRGNQLESTFKVLFSCLTSLSAVH